MHILPDPGPLLIGEARGPASDTETLCLGARYRTQRLPVPDPETLSIIYLFYLSFASNFIILDVAPLKCPRGANRPAKNARTTH